MIGPITSWVYTRLNDEGHLHTYGQVNLTNTFRNNLQIYFRRRFPADWGNFITLICADSNLMDKSASEYAQGVYDLQERVPTVVAKAAEHALSTNDTLLKAWQYCYAKDHDYDKVAVECQNALEKLLRDKYEPKQQRPQLGKQIGHIKSNVKKLTFKGDTIPTNKLILLDLIDKLPEFRGMHTAGNGTSPTKQEAEYILHTTIYIWGLHQS